MLLNKKHILNSIPSTSGVYLMKNKASKILYIGKAKNLKSRIKNYFSSDIATRSTVKPLISQIDDIETIIVNTEKEALILENSLIKKYKPKYNILLKDDKTYLSLMLTKDKFPTIAIVRKKKILDKKNRYFGPYTNAKAARQTLDLIFQLFKLRQCSLNEFKRRKTPCILYEMKKCLAPCVKKCSEEEYKKNVNFSIKLLNGKNKEVVKELKQKMKEASSKLEFEKANNFLQIIKKIEHVQEMQQVSNLKEKNFDVIGIYHEKTSLVISLLIFRNSKLIGSKHFSFSKIPYLIEDILESFLLQNYKKKEDLSKIIIPYELKNKKEIEDILSSSKKLKIIFFKKGKNKELLNMAFKNAKAIFLKEKTEDSLREKILLNLQTTLNLKNFPKHIICFDISSIAEKEKVGAMVTFINGKRDNKKTKLFKIKTEKKGDIYAFEEILKRHFSKENILPDLLILDGGKSHLNISLKALQSLSIASIDLLSIAKEKSLHTKTLTKEKIFLPYKKTPILFDAKSPILFLLQEIRDEAHKTAISFHKKIRSKFFFKTSLDEIAQIGSIKKKALLTKFKSIENIKKASLEELLKTEKISKKDAKTIFEKFRDKKF